MPNLAYYDEGGKGMRAMIAVTDAQEGGSIAIQIQYTDAGAPLDALSIVVPNAREFLAPIMKYLNDREGVR